MKIFLLNKNKLDQDTLFAVLLIINYLEKYKNEDNFFNINYFDKLLLYDAIKKNSDIDFKDYYLISNA